MKTTETWIIPKTLAGAERILMEPGWRWVIMDGGLNHVPARIDSMHLYVEGTKYTWEDGAWQNDDHGGSKIFRFGPAIEDPLA